MSVWKGKFIEKALYNKLNNKSKKIKFKNRQSCFFDYGRIMLYNGKEFKQLKYFPGNDRYKLGAFIKTRTLKKKKK